MFLLFFIESFDDAEGLKKKNFLAVAVRYCLRCFTEVVGSVVVYGVRYVMGVIVYLVGTSCVLLIIELQRIYSAVILVFPIRLRSLYILM